MKRISLLLSCKAAIMATLLTGVAFFFLSGDEVTVAATGEVKLRLTLQQKLLEAAVVTMVSLPLLLAMQWSVRKMLASSAGLGSSGRPHS